MSRMGARVSWVRQGCVLFGLGLAGWSATGWLLIHLKLGPVPVAAILLALAVTLLFLWARSWAHWAAAAFGPSLREAADYLAAALDVQWGHEAAVRRINDPYPLPVPWRSVPAHLVDPQSAADMHDLAGTGYDIVSVFRSIPTGRLLVLGSPGAGKSVLLVQFLLSFLRDRRRDGDPVPVLFPLASWNPAEQSLHEWMAERLVRDYPALEQDFTPEMGGPRMTLAAALVDGGHLVPVLDGLDEVPQAVRSSALDAINNVQGALVLSSRTEEYHATMTASRGMREAAGIELQPVSLVDAHAYLVRSNDRVMAGRWDAVFRGLQASASAAEALSTPLLLSLARSTYEPRPGESIDAVRDPAELLISTRSETPVADHLFDAFISASYRGRSYPWSWGPVQAERYFMYLAGQLTRDGGGTLDLAWWELSQAMPRHLVAIGAGLVVALAAGTAAGIAAGLPAAIIAGPLAGVAAGIAASRNRPPAGGLRWSLDDLGIGIAAGVGGVLAGGIRLGLPLAVASTLASSLKGSPADLTTAVGPAQVLSRDRRAFQVLTLVTGTAAALGVGLTYGPAAGVAAGITLGLVEAAWGAFAIARVYLALRRGLPLRFMSFLADAHRRGVLRQVGAVYQFRHLELQRRLAARYSELTD